MLFKKKREPHMPLSEAETRDQVDRLFARTRVLGEVDCPGAASDYYLFDEKEEFDRLIETLPPGTRVFLTSVVDLRNRGRALRVMTS